MLKYIFSDINLKKYKRIKDPCIIIFLVWFIIHSILNMDNILSGGPSITTPQYHNA